jgi:hypothetical protein
VIGEAELRYFCFPLLAFVNKTREAKQEGRERGEGRDERIDQGDSFHPESVNIRTGTC